MYQALNGEITCHLVVCCPFFSVYLTYVLLVAMRIKRFLQFTPDLLNPTTWQGWDNQHPFMLDLALLNDVALFNNLFSSLTVSFTDLLGSDHVALNISWIPVTAIPPTSPSPLPGFKILDELRDSWTCQFGLSPVPLITNIPSLEGAAKQLHADIDKASRSLFKPHQIPDP